MRDSDARMQNYYLLITATSNQHVHAVSVDGSDEGDDKSFIDDTDVPHQHASLRELFEAAAETAISGLLSADIHSFIHF